MWYLCAQFPPQEPRGWMAAPSMVYRWRWPIFSLAQNSIISEHQISVCICRWDATICVAGLGNWVGRRWPRAIDSFDRRMSTWATSRSQSIPKGGMFPEEEFAELMEIECLETVPRNSFEGNWNSSWKGSPRCGFALTQTTWSLIRLCNFDQTVYVMIWKLVKYGNIAQQIASRIVAESLAWDHDHAAVKDLRGHFGDNIHNGWVTFHFSIISKSPCVAFGSMDCGLCIH